MTAIYFKNLPIYTSKQFAESVYEDEEDNTKLYFAIGRVTPWSNESSPDQANSSVTTLYEVYRNMIGGKRITGNDIMHCIKRNDWTVGTVYDQYDHCVCSFSEANAKYYIVTPNWDVYKCISNNNGAPSQNVPTQKITTGTVKEVDGYVWKYMYTIEQAEQLRFTSDEYIPVKALENNNNSLQWQVQSNAIDGAIENIQITNSGTGYTDNTKISLTITGDGTGANAFVQTNTMSNTISAIVIDKVGAGYTYADVTINTEAGYGSNGAARAIISPPGGHGSDPLHELGGSNLMLNVRLRYDENDNLPVTNDFRQITIIQDPLNYGTSTIRSNSSFSQLTSLTLSGVGDDNFVEDEIVYQGTSLANATFTGTVVSWNGTNVVKLSNVKGTISAQSLIGVTSGATGVVSIPYVTPDLQPNSGRLLYIDNIVPIKRSSDQIEDFKIVIKF